MREGFSKEAENVFGNGRAELDVFSSLSVNDVNEVSFSSSAFSPFP